MDRDAEVRALMAEMRATLKRSTPFLRVDTDARMGLLSERVATLTAEMSLPEIMALSAMASDHKNHAQNAALIHANQRV